MKITSSLTLPPSAVSHTFGVIGQKGSGKTYTGTKITEQMLIAGAQVVAIDPTGVLWGLKAAGTGPGFPILIMGGIHGDVPLESTAGAVVAEFVASSQHSVILDLSEFPSKATKNRFVTDFAETLFLRKNASRSPLHLLLDEADDYIPQQPLPDQRRMLGAFDEIVRRGRSRGLGMTLITQRPAVINKNVLSQIDLLIAGRVTGPHDFKALTEWTRMCGTTTQQDAFLKALPSLPTGEAFFWSPAWLGIFERGKVLSKRTFDSSSTPEPGKPAATPKLTKVDLGVLSKQIQATVEAHNQNDPKALRAEVARLRAELANKPGPIDTTWADEFLDEAVKLVTGFEVAMTRMHDFVKQVGHRVNHSAPVELPKPPQVVPLPPAAVTTRTADAASRPDTADELSTPEQRVLRALFWLKGESATPHKVGFYADYSPKTSSFKNALGRLRSLGLVQGWAITDAGFNMLDGKLGRKPTGPELVAWLRSKLSGPENKVMDALLSYRGRKLTMPEIADITGYSMTTSSFKNAIGRLRTLEIAIGKGPEGTKINEILL